MISKYSEILICDLESPNGVKSLSKKVAVKYLNEISLESQAEEKDNDFILLNSSKRSRDAVQPLMCLRCKVSHDFYAYTKKLYLEKKRFHDVNLCEMLSFFLIDDAILKSDRIGISEPHSIIFDVISELLDLSSRLFLYCF